MRVHILIFISLAVVLMASTESHAQDVYNFYFQKNTGAQAPLGQLAPTQTSGLSSESTAPLSPPLPPTTVQADAKISSEPKKAFRRFDVSFAKAWVGSPTAVTDRVGSFGNYNGVDTREAYSLVLSYRFNRFVASEAGLIVSTNWQSEDPEKRGMGNGKDIDGNFGIAFTPIHINFFGYELIEMGVLAGFMTQTQFELETEAESYSNDGFFRDKSKTVIPYLGPRLAINLADELAVVLDGRLMPKSNGGGMASLGVKYRF